MTLRHNRNVTMKLPAHYQNDRFACKMDPIRFSKSFLLYHHRYCDWDSSRSAVVVESIEKFADDAKRSWNGDLYNA